MFGKRSAIGTDVTRRDTETSAFILRDPTARHEAKGALQVRSSEPSSLSRTLYRSKIRGGWGGMWKDGNTGTLTLWTIQVLRIIICMPDGQFAPVA